MKAVRPAADTHGQPAAMLAGDQAPRHREGVDERHQRCAHRAAHFTALDTRSRSSVLLTSRVRPMPPTAGAAVSPLLGGVAAADLCRWGRQTDPASSSPIAAGRIHHAEALASATRAVTPSATATPAAIRQPSPITKSQKEAQEGFNSLHAPGRLRVDRARRDPLTPLDRGDEPERQQGGCGDDHEQRGVAAWPVRARAFGSPEHAER